MAAASIKDALSHISEARKIISSLGSSASFEDSSTLKEFALLLLEDIDRSREQKWIETLGDLQTRLTDRAKSTFNSVYSKLQALLEERESLISIHEQEKQSLVSSHKAELEKLQKQINEENFCVICHERSRDTLVMPCSHFQFCFSCMLDHQKANGNTCPTCRGPINGLCMSDPNKMKRSGGSSVVGGVMVSGYSAADAPNLPN